MKPKYTIPTLFKGKRPLSIPKGSSLEKELAKNVWYVNYSYNGKQYRIKGNLNRIKDPKEKALQGEILLQSIKNDLANGYNPENIDSYEKLLKQNEITLKEATDEYIRDCSNHARTKTVQTYSSKLNHLMDKHGDKRVVDITSKDIEKYIYDKIHGADNAVMYVDGKKFDLERKTAWTPKTVASARRIFNTFFNWCIENNYRSDNPVTIIDNKKIKSNNEPEERNNPFSEEDAEKIINYLDKFDKKTAFFCRFIYHTLLRPGEIRKLRVKDIDLKNKRLRIPTSVMKNSKKNEADFINLSDEIIKVLMENKIGEQPKSNYLFSKNSDIFFGNEPIGVNSAYEGLKKALDILGLTQKGYNLYSFKHFSNIQRYNHGWTYVEIMKANRHTSIVTTEAYLRKITFQTDISKKTIPLI
jgi:integrase